MSSNRHGAFDGLCKEHTMSDKEAFALIGRRAQELAALPEIREKMTALAVKSGKEAAERMVYLMAIATLAGV